MKLPQAFINRTALLLGDSFSLFVDALQLPAPTSIRINPAKIFHTPQLEQVPWSSRGYYLPERPLFTLDPLLHAGAYYVQEASSMFLEQIVKLYIPQAVKMLDLCAAPGGKTTHLLSLLHPDSLLVANEYVRSRAYILSENIQKWGHSNVLVSNNQPEDFTPLSSFFDAVLVDAPCSGEGMFRKDAGAIEEWSVANVEKCVARQRSLLKDVWPSLKNEGILIYSTCTYNRDENEHAVKWIMEELGAELLSVKIDEAWGVTPTDFGYRFYPHKTKGEGLFMAVLRKTNTEQCLRIKTDKKKISFTKQQLDVEPFIVQSQNYVFQNFGNKIIAFPSYQADSIQFLLKQLQVLQVGIFLMECKGKDLIPQAGLALSVSLNRTNCETAALDWHTALLYLRNENIQLPSSPKGFVLVCYKNKALGWVKNLGNRCNSLYPSEWRIRMTIPPDAIENSFLSKLLHE
ncbi:MAG: rRNA cytosine-C5-methyltransferase [Paludibacteraceae bacterium]|nr:rRNA cytosine-C5-methyltransferase [Paludibacteraceae bacterium]MBN2786923.1 rRNA cytosine-C5-methyltransferase [Paludibacteraceae bacterium]